MSDCKTKKGSPFRQWSEKCKYLKDKGCKITTSTLLEDISNEDEIIRGLDLADYILN